MQKITLREMVREELIRAGIFGISFFAILVSGFVGITYAADGGIFGTLLNTILEKTWDDPTNDGTVKNATKLGGNTASAYVSVGTNRSCDAPQCIYGFDSHGDVLCR